MGFRRRFVLKQHLHKDTDFKDRLAIFTNCPSVTKDHALEEMVLTLFHPVVHGCFQLVGVKIQSPVMMLSKANSQKSD